MKVYQMKGTDVKEISVKLGVEQLYEKASMGLLQLSISLGLDVMRKMMEEEVATYAGPKGKHGTPERTGYRHGTEQTTIVLGGQKIHTERPRVRAVDGTGELPLEVLKLFQDEDPLNEVILARILNGVSMRKYARTLDVPGTKPVSTSKSAVSRRFVASMEQVMAEFFKRPIEGRYPVVILDGIGLGETTAVAAMGIDADGHKKILGLTVGGTENNEVVKGLLADMIGRGLDPGEGRLYVIDGGKALHKAITDTFGATAVVQRCQVHKKRNVLAHLPKSEQDNVSLALSMAYLEADFDLARKELMDIAAGLSSRYPKAATSLLEGLEETLTVHRLKVPGLLRKTLCNTNVLESANSSCRGVLRRVSNFKDGEMALRYAAAGFLQAERGFRRITGYKELGFLEAKLSAYDALPRSIQTA